MREGTTLNKHQSKQSGDQNMTVLGKLFVIARPVLSYIKHTKVKS